MMPTTEQIWTIFSSARTGRDFPRVVAELKNIGIRGFSYHIVSGDTLCYDDAGETFRLPGRNTLCQPVAPVKNLARLTHVLHAHQAGLTDFPTFCLQAADAGVSLWVADLSRMTVSYFTTGGYLMSEEAIPDSTQK